eukprot:scaffold10190_cov294-Chaetoceros_neogracile.AAC.20
MKSNGKGNTRITNPYTSTIPISSASTQRQEQQSVAATPRPTEVNTNASFSQAFGNVEETTHHSNETTLDRSNSNLSTNSAAPTRTISSIKVPTSNELALLQPHVLHVSTKQRGNGIIRYLRNVPFAYAKIAPDYIVGPNRCVLFLSFKYHNLHPNYVHRRVAELKSDFDLRILLCLVDVEDNSSILLFLNKLCCINNMTMILAWSEQEAARYLETFKAFESKDASTIQKKKEVTFSEQVVDALGCIRSVNKTDAATLTSQFGNLRKVMNASIDDIRLCPGIGEKKARRLHEAFNKPFSSAMAKKRKVERLTTETVIKDFGEHEEGEDMKITIDEIE